MGTFVVLFRSLPFRVQRAGFQGFEVQLVLFSLLTLQRGEFWKLRPVYHLVVWERGVNGKFKL